MNVLIKPTKLSQIVLAMVRGLRNPKVEINMCTFGRQINNTCFGCAAACALIELGADPALLPHLLDAKEGFSAFYKEKWVINIEDLVNHIRQGSDNKQHKTAWQLDELDLPNPPISLLNEHHQLPPLTNFYTPEQLTQYETWGRKLEQAGY